MMIMVALEGTMGSPSSSSMDVGEWMHLPGVVPYGAAAAASIRIRVLVSTMYSQILRLVSNLVILVFFSCCSRKVAHPLPVAADTNYQRE